MEVSQHTREVARGSLWGLLGSIAFKLSSFFYTILLARAASMDDVGLFYLSLGIMNMAIVISDMGIPSAMVRYIPYFEGKKEEGKTRALLLYGHAALLILGIIFMGGLFLISDTLGRMNGSGALPGAIRMMSLFIVLNNIFRLHHMSLQGMADIKGSQLVMNIQNFSKLVLTAVLFWFFGVSLEAIIAAFLASHLIAIGFSGLKLFSLERRIQSSGGIHPAALFREVAPLGIMIAAVQSFGTIVASADRIMLGFLIPSSNELVAVYSIATTAAVVLMVLPSSVGNIFLPVVSRLAGKGEMGQMNAVMETAQRWMLFLTLPASVIVMAFSGELLGGFYGESYAAGGLAMAIFTLGMVFNSMYLIIQLSLAAMRLIKIEFLIALAAGILNIALNWLLIPIYGMEGSAMASAGGFALALALSYHYGRKLFSYEFPPEVLRLLLSAALTLLILIALKGQIMQASSSILFDDGSYASRAAYLLLLGALAIIAGTLFIMMSILFKCLRSEDAALIEKAMNRARVPAMFSAPACRIASYGVAEPHFPGPGGPKRAAQ